MLRFPESLTRFKVTQPLWLSFAFVTVVTVGAMGIFGFRHLTDSGRRQVQSSQIQLVREATVGVERQTARGPVNINVLLNVSGFDVYSLGQAVAWSLTADGWQPQLDASFTAISGITYHRSSAWPDVDVSFKGPNASVHRYVCNICELVRAKHSRNSPRH